MVVTSLQGTVTREPWAVEILYIRSGIDVDGFRIVLFSQRILTYGTIIALSF